MEVFIAVAKVKKYATPSSGDTVEVVERPNGGVSVVLADGQSSGRGAKSISTLVVRKVISLIAEGVPDSAAARAASDYLYPSATGKYPLPSIFSRSTNRLQHWSSRVTIPCQPYLLQEFYVQATRPTRQHRLSHEQASLLIESWLRFPVKDITVPIMLAAATAAQASHISYWDAAVIEAARALGCATVLSEDLADGRDYSGVHVENPFRTVA